MSNKIRHAGVIEAITEDCVRVKIMQTSACSACKLASHCSASEQKEKVVEVFDTHAADGRHVGDNVVVSTSLSTGMKAVMVGFVLPFAVMVATLVLVLQFTGNEYLVYLPNGTKRLGIKHPDYLPTTIVFADYGTKKVASATTYELKVKTNKKKAKVDASKKGIAVFNIKPSNAMLLIDGQIADGSGGAYALSLPYGTHYYTVKLKDFSINNQSVQIDKNAKNINVDLTEFFAKVDVSCKTEDADIFINNEQKGVGKWGGDDDSWKIYYRCSKRRLPSSKQTD